MVRDDSARQNAVDPARLDREGLLALVGDLQQTILRQHGEIMRQAATIAALGGQPGGAAPARPPKKRAFRPAPGFDLTIVFDGGAIGNPGKGYGSYQIVDAAGAVVAQERLDFGDAITNNGAEFRTLIAALERALAEANGSPGPRIAVRGDSQLVIYGVTGQWKIKHPDLKPLHERAKALLDRFAAADVQWHRRDRSVDALGH
jgi:ribonuclease HI